MSYLFYLCVCASVCIHTCIYVSWNMRPLEENLPEFVLYPEGPGNGTWVIWLGPKHVFIEQNMMFSCM